MKVCDYIVDILIQHGITDSFGIPGAVLLDLLYAMQRRGPEITPHLCYHEQGAGFAALGYAQSTGKLGMAYGTRGPGFTNLVTAIADAYADSIPVLFITSHVGPMPLSDMRIVVNQEIDTCQMVAKITKYAKRIDNIDDLPKCLNEACKNAMSGRMGPVFLDVNSNLWNVDVLPEDYNAVNFEEENFQISYNDIAIVESVINDSKRPVILIGDGVNQKNMSDELCDLITKLRIPVLSSRYAHHTLAMNDLYYGYIGSYGLRYANFILSKTDLIISLGNRLNFPIYSKSYGVIPQQAKIIRFEIDKAEFERSIPNSINIYSDLKDVILSLKQHHWSIKSFDEWICVCDTLREKLIDADTEGVPAIIEQFLSKIPNDTCIVNDVGNNEFWVSRACARVSYIGKVLYSKNFASMGNALPKAIGACFATRKPVVCFVGDHGFQLNSQELQTISQNNLPILIVIINNHVSGMIRDKEKNKSEGYLHSTKESGYGMPDLFKLAAAYGLRCVNSLVEVTDIFFSSKVPMLVDLSIETDFVLHPYLPIGNNAQEMMPMLEKRLFEQLNIL